MALIEIDGLPSYKMVIFHGYVSHNQMVVSIITIQEQVLISTETACSNIDNF